MPVGATSVPKGMVMRRHGAGRTQTPRNGVAWHPVEDFPGDFRLGRPRDSNFESPFLFAPLGRAILDWERSKSP